MKQNDPKSLIMLTVSMLIYGSIGIFRRFIPLPSATLACCRGFLGALFLIIVVKVQGKRVLHRPEPKVILMLVISGAVMGFNWILLFEAYNYTTVATATLCYYMQPTIVILLSPFAFGERITGKKWVCVILSVIGMILVSGVIEGGLPQASELKGILLGLGAAVLYATVVIINKKISGVDAYEKTVIQLLSAAAAVIPYILLTGQTVSAEWTPRDVVMLLIVCIVHTGIAYALYFGSMDGLRAQTVAILSYLDPVTALVLSAVILREPVTGYGVLGAVLIIGAAVVSEM